MRVSFNTIYMGLAHSLARRSTCDRLAVGTVITTTDYRRVLAVGYNGNAAGLPNCCDDSAAVGSCGCLHSEDNAVVNCVADRSIPKYVFVTHAPCVMCAKRLINLGGVETVYYTESYRSAAGLAMLAEGGLPAVQLEKELLWL